MELCSSAFGSISLVSAKGPVFSIAALTYSLYVSAAINVWVHHWMVPLVRARGRLRALTSANDDCDALTGKPPQTAAAVYQWHQNCAPYGADLLNSNHHGLSENAMRICEKHCIN